MENFVALLKFIFLLLLTSFHLHDTAGEWYPSNLRKLYMYVNKLQLLVMYSLSAMGTSYTQGMLCYEYLNSGDTEFQ